MSAPVDIARSTRSRHWSSTAAAQLRDASRCPVCTRALRDGLCPHCGADLRGSHGVEVWQAATAAASALAALQAVVARVPRGAGGTATPAPPASASATAARPAPGTPRTERTSASTTLQSVLAVAGAGLVAMAALVFTLLNPDLTDPAARGSALSVAAALFIVSAPPLQHRALRVSAECAAALGTVFAALAITAFGQSTPAVDPWAVATVSSLVGGAVVLGLGVRTGIRAWMLVGSLALASVPLLASTLVGGPLSALWGALGSAAAALALLDGAARLDARGTLVRHRERSALVALQLLAALLFIGAVFDTVLDASGTDGAPGAERWVMTAIAVLGAGAVAARSARHALRRLWSFTCGASLPAALVIGALALDPDLIGGPSAPLVTVPVSAALGLLVAGAAWRADAPARRRTVLAGAMTVVLMTITPPIALAALGTVAALLSAGSIGLDATTGVAAVLAIVVVSAAFAMHGRLLAARARRSIRAARAMRASALWMLGVAALGALGIAAADPATRSAVAIALIVASCSIISGTELGRRSALADRLPIVLASHAALLITLSLSWQSIGLAVALGPAALVALAALARTVPRVLRPAYLAAGYAYGLVLIAAALSLATVQGPALLSLTATAGLAGAIITTFLPRVDAVRWITVLGVATVPFALAVGLVVFERSGWVALSTTTMILLATSLLATRRPGLGLIVRVLAGAVIVPSIAVALVTLGAELLVMSGSPVVLPAIAIVVAVTVPLLPRVVAAMPRRGMPVAHAGLVGRAIEASALLTAGIAVLLAFGRDAAGPTTALIVLSLLALGTGTTAALRHSTLYWWICGTTTTAALWCLWLVLGVDAIEAHLLPPALGAATIALVLTARGAPRPELYGAGLLMAIVPVLGLVALDTEPAPARVIGLLAGSVALTVLGASILTGRPASSRRLDALHSPTLIAAIAAGLVGAAAASRVGLGLDAVDASSAPRVLVVLAIALVGAVPMAIAGLLLTARSDAAARRWALVPAISALTIATCTAIDRDALTVAVIWSLMLGLLVTMVVAVARESRGRPTTLPRAWLLFVLAFGTAIVAWSPRDLRVEWFSLPLGLLLLVAGAIAMRRPALGPATPPHHWPAGRSGSWLLLGPGLVVLVLASMLATATDPQTWRAVLVMALALVFILMGVRWRLAAPFVLGMVVLPIENVLAFSVQIGRGIEAMPWWITLAVVGLVLLVIAVGSERREGDDRSPTARLRDLG